VPGNATVVVSALRGAAMGSRFASVASPDVTATFEVRLTSGSPPFCCGQLTVQAGSFGDIMRFPALSQLVPVSLLAAAVLAIPTAATGAPPIPNDPLAPFGPFDLPAGIACPDFDLRIEGSDPMGKVRTFVDRNGDPVRILTTGLGYTLTFTNLETGEELVTRSTGSSQVTVPNADGTYSSTIRGSALIILFPEDDPAGPSSNIYHGRTVFSLESDGSTFTSLETYGTSSDICEALT